MKKIHKSFCLYTLENLTEYLPRGSYLVLKSTPIVPGRGRIQYIAVATYFNKNFNNYYNEFNYYSEYFNEFK